MYSSSVIEGLTLTNLGGLGPQSPPPWPRLCHGGGAKISAFDHFHGIWSTGLFLRENCDPRIIFSRKHWSSDDFFQ